MKPVLMERSRLREDLVSKLTLSSEAAADVSDQLESNINKEHVTSSLIFDFITLHVGGGCGVWEAGRGMSHEAS